MSPFPFDYSPSSFPQLDEHRPSHQPAAGLVSQSGTCMITNSWKSKTHWAEGVGGGAAESLGGGEGMGLKAVEEGRKRSVVFFTNVLFSISHFPYPL